MEILGLSISKELIFVAMLFPLFIILGLAPMILDFYKEDGKKKSKNHNFILSNFL